MFYFFFFQAEDGIRDHAQSRGLGDVYKRQEDIELKITSGDFEAGYNQSLILLNTIQEKNLVTSIYLSHQEFDNVLNEAVKLSTYLVHEDETEAHTSLHLLKHNTDHIKKLQSLNLENIIQQ
eukprot:TRINITY_DN28537_c0_g1_i1.p2 TRINITY_DN28537_c0_g1~~TRINITY_DN28537_c0_g1_i1.p2  ORF type:complete len:122 (-),score=27.61 TRINITY_DN28537_c0_g1_i1:8-373(-)